MTVRQRWHKPLQFAVFVASLTCGAAVASGWLYLMAYALPPK